jgi:hypothetical protein
VGVGNRPFFRFGQGRAENDGRWFEPLDHQDRPGGDKEEKGSAEGDHEEDHPRHEALHTRPQAEEPPQQSVVRHPVISSLSFP